MIISTTFTGWLMEGLLIFKHAPASKWFPIWTLWMMRIRGSTLSTGNFRILLSIYFATTFYLTVNYNRFILCSISIYPCYWELCNLYLFCLLQTTALKNLVKMCSKSIPCHLNFYYSINQILYLKGLDSFPFIKTFTFYYPILSFKKREVSNYQWLSLFGCLPLVR